MVQHVSTAPVTTAPGATALDQLEKAGLKKHRSLWTTPGVNSATTGWP